MQRAIGAGLYDTKKFLNELRSRFLSYSQILFFKKNTYCLEIEFELGYFIAKFNDWGDELNLMVTHASPVGTLLQTLNES